MVNGQDYSSPERTPTPPTGPPDQAGQQGTPDWEASPIGKPSETDLLQMWFMLIDLFWKSLVSVSDMSEKEQLYYICF